MAYKKVRRLDLCLVKSWIEGPLLGPALEALLGDALGAELGPLDCVHSKTASIRIKVTLNHL